MAEEIDVTQTPEEVDAAKKIEALKAKVDELSRLLEEKKGLTEEKIKENPYAYLMGAFVGGLILGFMLSRRD